MDGGSDDDSMELIMVGDDDMDEFDDEVVEYASSYETSHGLYWTNDSQRPLNPMGTAFQKQYVRHTSDTPSSCKKRKAVVGDAVESHRKTGRQNLYSSSPGSNPFFGGLSASSSPSLHSLAVNSSAYAASNPPLAPMDSDGPCPVGSGSHSPSLQGDERFGQGYSPLVQQFGRMRCESGGAGSFGSLYQSC